jgi:small membrane protein
VNSFWESWRVGIKILLTVGLVTFLVYGTSQRDKSWFVFYGTLAITAIGSFFIWAPEQANNLAYLLGVGRGADLVLYCWILTSLIVALNLHLLIRANLQLTTELARQLALSHPLKPPEQVHSRSAAAAAPQYTGDDNKRAPPPSAAPVDGVG